MTKRHTLWSINCILECLHLKVNSSMWSELRPPRPLCPCWFIINTSAYLLQRPEFAKQPWLIGYWRPHSASSSTNNHSHTRLLSAHLSSTSANSVWAACWYGIQCYPTDNVVSQQSRHSVDTDGKESVSEILIKTEAWYK